VSQVETIPVHTTFALSDDDSSDDERQRKKKQAKSEKGRIKRQKTTIDWTEFNRKQRS